MLKFSGSSWLIGELTFIWNQRYTSKLISVYLLTTTSYHRSIIHDNTLDCLTSRVVIKYSDRHALISTRCVQMFNDSLVSANRKIYRFSLRSSSTWEPRHPLLKVFKLQWYSVVYEDLFFVLQSRKVKETTSKLKNLLIMVRKTKYPVKGWIFGNDPSAGSPTETLLRLHLPLNDEV